MRCRHIGRNLGERLLLRPGQFIGQGSADFRFNPPVAFQDTSGFSFHLTAHQLQCELIGKQFVIGEARARRGITFQIRLAFRMMRPDQAFFPSGPVFPFQKRRILPFRQIGQQGKELSRRL